MQQIKRVYEASVKMLEDAATDWSIPVSDKNFIEAQQELQGMAQEIANTFKMKKTLNALQREKEQNADRRSQLERQKEDLARQNLDLVRENREREKALQSEQEKNMEVTLL